MNNRLTLLLVPACLTLLLTGCSGVKVWPFDGGSTPTRSGAPANATEYQCDGGKHFYMRMADNGATAWLIYPDREVSLAKASAAAGVRYSNGVAVLDIKSAEATLSDGPQIAYTGCKAMSQK